MRYITFRLPGFPKLAVTAREMTDGTLKLDFAITGSKASLQGIFLNTLAESNIVIRGADVTGTGTGGVTKPGPGTSIMGTHGLNEGFDFGMAVGFPGRGSGIVQSTSITLSSVDHTKLTLDSLSHELLGIRLQGAGAAGPKHVMTMPAAPDAKDDVVWATEDVAKTILATANDTDGDGNVLSIVKLTGVDNGTAAIVNNAIVFTPAANWSGIETFTYQVADGTGGFDDAKVTVKVDAVADAPTLSTGIRAGANVQEILVDISSALVDRDGSETYQLRIGAVPAGVTLAGATFRDGYWWIDKPTGSDHLSLTLADGASYDFDLKIDAISHEDPTKPGPKTNDTAITSTTIKIDVEHAVQTSHLDFDATDQSQWTAGDAFVFDDNRFIGLDEPKNTDGPASDSYSLLGITASGSYDFHVGLQSDLHIGGGEVDATVPYDLSIDSTFNHTTDVLVLDTDATRADGGSFSTQGPELTYALAFVYDVFMSAALSIKGFGTVVNPTVDVSGSETIFEFDSKTDPSVSVALGKYLTATLAWPNLEVDGTASGGGYAGNGASNNFFELALDVDAIITALTKVPLSFGDTFSVAGVDVAGYEVGLIDVKLLAGMNFLQDMSLDPTADAHIGATLVLEDGTTQAFTFGDDLEIRNASSHDSNHDGDVSYGIDLDLDGWDFSNDTSIGFNIGWALKLIYVEAFIAGIVDFSWEAFEASESYPVGSISVYDNSFELNFGNEHLSGLA